MHNSTGTDTSSPKNPKQYSEWYNDVIPLCKECCDEIDLDVTEASYQNHTRTEACTICEENGYHFVFIISTLEEHIHETIATFTDLERASFNDITMRDYGITSELLTE